MEKQTSINPAKEREDFDSTISFNANPEQALHRLKLLINVFFSKRWRWMFAENRAMLRLKIIPGLP